MTKKRYAVVGTGARSSMYIDALAGSDYKDCAELVAFCDINQGRMDYYNERIGKSTHCGNCFDCWEMMLLRLPKRHCQPIVRNCCKF